MSLEAFPDLSSREHAVQCKVSDKTVESVREENQVRNSAPAKRTGADGKSYSLPTKSQPKPEPIPTQEEIEANDDAFRAKEAEPASSFNAGEDENQVRNSAPAKRTEISLGISQPAQSQQKSPPIKVGLMVRWKHYAVTPRPLSINS